MLHETAYRMAKWIMYGNCPSVHPESKEEREKFLKLVSQCAEALEAKGSGYSLDWL